MIHIPAYLLTHFITNAQNNPEPCQYLALGHPKASSGMIQLSEHLAMMPLVNSGHLEWAESGIYTLRNGRSAGVGA